MLSRVKLLMNQTKLIFIRPSILLPLTTSATERLKRRTNYDLAMIKEIGYCNGIENYSRHLSGRKKGEAPATLLDYFPKKRRTTQNERGQTQIIEEADF